MEIKDQNIETAIDENGNEYVSEISATMTETSEDGTVAVAEMTTTASADDPTDVESVMTVTETAPDGTETVTEYVANEEGVFKVDEDSDLENAAEAIFGGEFDDDLTKVMNADGTPVSEDSTKTVDSADSDSDVYVAEADTDADDFTVGEDMFTETENETGETYETVSTDESYDPALERVDPTFVEIPTYDSTITEPAAFDSPVDSSTTSTDPAYLSSENEVSDEDAQEIADQQAHTEAATDAQNAADEFVAQGDYAAAAEARETAENESWEAGDGSMLGSSDAQDLRTAAEKQDDAEYYEQQQAINAQAGDWEAAKEDAQNAAYATSDADYRAGGDDHTGQADSEIYNMDNAQWHQEIADDAAQNAATAAEDGNFYAAEIYADSADKEQAAADDFGLQGEHGNILADYDSSSEVATGGSYESTYEDNLADVDTGFDTTVDTGYDSGFEIADAGYDTEMSASVDTGFDTTVDTTTVDTSYDSGSSDV